MAHPVFDNAERAEREAIRLRRSRMKDHSKGEWSAGKTGGVVTDHWPDVLVGKRGSKADLHEYHGGYPVCDGVSTNADRELIAAAPGMYHELLRQMREAWMRADYKTADRIADLIGEVRPTDYEKEDL